MAYVLKISSVALAATLASCATPGDGAKHVGDTKKTAVEVCRPQGERAYLARLACPSGEAPTFHRTGSVGWRNDLPNGGPNLTSNPFDPLPPGIADWHIVDAYEVACGATKRTIYLDMYHCDRPMPDTVPDGFTLRSTKS